MYMIGIYICMYIYICTYMYIYIYIPILGGTTFIFLSVLSPGPRAESLAGQQKKPAEAGERGVNRKTKGGWLQLTLGLPNKLSKKQTNTNSRQSLGKKHK